MIMYLFILILGILIGSFLNVVIYRMPRELSFTKGRSVCTNCSNQIKWFDLIPILSFILLRGKCRHCKSKISIQYVLVEILTGFSFLIVTIFSVKSNLNIISLILLLIITSLIIVGIFTDFTLHGVFNFSTIQLLIPAILILYIEHVSLLDITKKIITSLIYIVPVLVICTYCFLRDTKRKILGYSLMGAFTFALFTFIATVPIAELPIYLLITGLALWVPIFIILRLGTLLVKLVLKNKSVVRKITNTLDSVSFSIFIVVLFNLKITIPQILQQLLNNPIPNLIIFILASCLFIFMKELENIHDNDEEIISKNEDTIERSENFFNTEFEGVTIGDYIGDGDTLTLPFIGLLLGTHHIVAFYIFLGVLSTITYCLILRKGVKYSIPLYPFIILSALIISIL